MNAAREKVRVGHALKQLPQISASFAIGELSFSKVRAVTRIADPENEKELLDLARHATAAANSMMASDWRRTRFAASLATAACCTSPRISRAIHSISAARPARCRRQCSERCDHATAVAAFRDAPMSVSSTPITFGTGHTVAKHRSITSFYCAAVTTVSCTKVESVSRRSPTVAFVSRGPMAG